jgi:hypothetical protein
VLRKFSLRFSPVNIMLEIWRSKEVYANQKYRGASKRWASRWMKSIVVQQKDGITVNTEIS